MGKGRGRAKQLVLARTAGHGGKRKGAGRPAGKRRRVAHRKRPPHARNKPVHLTMRARRGLPSLRCEAVRTLLRRLLADGEHDDFRIIEHSIQRDHIHLVGEANDARALSSGMRRLAIRFAKRLNRLLGRRKGRVWDHRYHRHDLATPREVRSTLLYVLQNAKKHGEAEASASFLDPFSSAAWFEGWSDHRARDPTGDASWRPPRARSWLLTVGWRRRGLLRTTDAPKAVREISRGGVDRSTGSTFAGSPTNVMRMDASEALSPSAITRLVTAWPEGYAAWRALARGSRPDKLVTPSTSPPSIGGIHDSWRCLGRARAWCWKRLGSCVVLHARMKMIFGCDVPRREGPESRMLAAMTKRCLSTLLLAGVVACKGTSSGSGPTAAADAAPVVTAAPEAGAGAGAPHQADCREPKDDACVLLGVEYAYGRGVAKDEARGAQLQRAACDAKNPTGCTFFGAMVRAGKGVPKEKWKARGIRADTLAEVGKKASLYQTACDAGEAVACTHLARAYELGEGTAKDARKAASLFGRAGEVLLDGCQKNDLMACASLGELELKGDGVAKNEGAAIAHFEKACEGGDATGCLSLGVAYEGGTAGRPKDVTKAASYFVRACDGGEDMGCENAGHVYESGRGGVKADKKTAQRVYKTACDRGDEAACGAYRRVGGT